MKNKILKRMGIAFLLPFLMVSCKNNFEEINTDPVNTPNALPEQLLAPALVSTLNANMIRNRNFNNELMQVTVSISDGDATVFRYEFRRTFSDYLWNSWYVQLTNFKDLYAQASNPLTLNKSYQGISLICQSWIYSMLTDTYGDVPYFESNKAKEGIREPKFDTQKDIYSDIFSKLEEANTLLSSNAAISANSDPVFNGNVSKWRKFGNSLYLRLLLRVSGKAEVSDDAVAKIKEIVDTKSSTYPVMASNDDSAILRWTGIAPYTSPYIGIREQDFRSPAIASFFIDNLVYWKDPRIDISTFGRDGVNRWGISQGSSGFAGVPSGYLPGAGVTKQSAFYSMASVVSSKPAQTLQTDPLTGNIMNYAELQFILAEAAARGWVSKSAETCYYTGILNSITLWLPNWPNATATSTAPSGVKITDAAFTNYISTAELGWDENLPLDAPRPQNSKLEKIHRQKYYTMFLTDLQQWFEYRRTGHPQIEIGPGLRNNGEMPSRMTYPVYVESANPTNYKAAVSVQGPDQINTKVWWQIPN